MLTFIYNSIWEEIKPVRSFPGYLANTIRIIAFLGCLIFLFFMILMTLLAENESGKPEVMFLYISFLYTIYLTGLLFLPWKIIIMSKRNSSLFTMINFSSFVVFSIIQFLSVYFHQSQINLSMLSDSYFLIMIQIGILLLIQLLFRWFFKLYHPTQKSKNLKEEWKRLSRYTLY